MSRLGKTSFDIESIIFDEEQNAVCHAIVVAVCFDFDSQKSVDVYESIISDYEG